jgi:hypothetical protein
VLASKKPSVGGGGGITIRELDGSPSVAATELVLPNGTISVVGSVVTVGNLALLSAANQFSNTNTFNGTPNPSFPQRVGNLQIVEGGLVQSGNGDTDGTGTPRQIQRFNSTQTDTDAVGWGFIYTQGGSFTSSDAVTYRDHVYVFGLNVTGSGTRIDNDKPYLAFQFESKFTNSDSTKFGSEWHLEHKAPGAAAPNLRALSAFLPFDLTQRGLGSFAWALDTHLWADQQGVTRMQFNLHDNDLLMFACRQYFNTNNAAPLQQRNAANSSYLSLPWIDNLDRLRISQPSFAQGATTSGNGNAAHQYQALSWAANNHMVMAVNGASDAVSGSKIYSGIQATASINGEWNNRITNTFAGGEAVWDALVSGTGGRAKSIYRTFSQGGFDVGYDGVTDTFIISRAQGLGIDSLTYVTMTRASNVPANSVWTHRGSVIVTGTLMIGGTGGPLFRNNAGTIEARNNANNAGAPFACTNLTASGTVSGSNLSGTNTGDQTITLTGMVTGSGTGSFAASLGSFTKAQLDTAVSDGNVLYVGDAPTAHVHAGADITTGTVDPARLGSGSSITTKFLRGDSTWQTISGGGDALVASNLDQFADVTQTAGQTLSITSSTTLSGGTHSGTNTGDNAANSLYSGLVSNATHTGDVTGDTVLTIANSAVTLAKTTGIQKVITSGTAAPSGGVDGDIYLQYT